LADQAVQAGRDNQLSQAGAMLDDIENEFRQVEGTLKRFIA
jgi:hypothetical protein